MKPEAQVYVNQANDIAREIDALVESLPFRLRWQWRVRLWVERLPDRLWWFVREHRLWWWWIP